MYAELTVFETLLRAPSREFYYVRHRTLVALRWMGAERVARAALRDGKSKEQATALLQRMTAHVATPPFYEAANCVAWVIGCAYPDENA